MSKDKVCNKYYKYILFISLAQLIDSFIYGFNHNESFKEIRFASKKFSNNILVHRFFYYIGTFILGFFLNRYEKNSLKKEEIININQNRNESKNNINKVHIESNIIEPNTGTNRKKNYYIYNNFITDIKTIKLGLTLLLTLIIWIIIEKSIDSYTIIFQDLDFWMIEILIISILNLKFNKKPIYRHQILAIVLNIISSLFKIKTIILSFEDNNEEKYYKDIPDKDNYNGHLPIIYKNNPIIYITLGIIIYLLLIFMRASIYLTIKHFMEIKYIMPSNIIKDFGGMGILISFIMCILSTLICCKEKDNKIEIYNYICKVEYENKYFFDNFICFFHNLYTVEIEQQLREIGIIIFGFITFFTNKYFTILVIKELSPVHVIFSVPFVFIFQKSIALLYTRLIEGKFYIVDNKYKIKKCNLDLSGDTVSIFAFLIYLEIFVLTICNCDYYTRKEIKSRANNEHKIIDDSNSSSFEDSQIDLIN